MARKSWKERISPARLRRRAMASGLVFSALCKFHVDDLASGGVSFVEYFELRGERSLELAAIVRAAAGADGGDVLMGLEKTVNFGKGGERLLQVIQTKFQKRVVAGHGLGGRQHFFECVRTRAPGRLWAAAWAEAGRESGGRCQGHLFSLFSSLSSNDGAILQGRSSADATTQIAREVGAHSGNTLGKSGSTPS